jgi:hypothetical protein
MKSAYFSEGSRADSVVLVKLLIHGYHPNKLNLFNQVSLIALNFLGHTYPIADTAHDFLPPIHPLNSSQLPLSTRFEDDLHFDNSTVERLRQLEDAKKEAVGKGDYERAIHLRNAIKSLQETGTRLNAMVARKRKHMEAQEYYQAGKLK